jgi:hypothetical protein
METDHGKDPERTTRFGPAQSVVRWWILGVPDGISFGIDQELTDLVFQTFNAEREFAHDFVELLDRLVLVRHADFEFENLLIYGHGRQSSASGPVRLAGPDRCRHGSISSKWPG